jgi:hypothetical protein
MGIFPSLHARQVRRLSAVYLVGTSFALTKIDDFASESKTIDWQENLPFSIDRQNCLASYKENRDD